VDGRQPDADGQRLIARYRESKRIAAANAIADREFTGLSTAAIRNALNDGRASDVALIEKVRAMGKRPGPEVFRAQSGLNRDRVTTKPITCPVYVIAATQDRLRSSAEAEELAALTGACLDYVESCGHLIPLEKPGELAGFVSRWLNENGI